MTMDTYITLRSGLVRTQQPKEDKIAKSLDLTPIVDEPRPVNAIVERPSDNIPEKDLEYSRENLYHLIEKGRNALDGILNLADQSQSPRAYEVAGQIIKTMTDTNRDLIDLQVKAKDLFAEKLDPRTINNNLFVGKTAELTKLLGGTARDVEKSKKRINESN